MSAPKELEVCSGIPLDEHLEEDTSNSSQATKDDEGLLEKKQLIHAYLAVVSGAFAMLLFMLLLDPLFSQSGQTGSPTVIAVPMIRETTSLRGGAPFDGDYSIILDSSNFTDFVENHQNVFVDFYAPWCVWSQRLSPIWASFAAEMNIEKKLDVSVASVDCIANSDLCRQLKILAFPTLRWYRQGQISPPEYKQDRTVQAFRAFSRSKLGLIPEEPAFEHPCVDAYNTLREQLGVSEASYDDEEDGPHLETREVVEHERYDAPASSRDERLERVEPPVVEEEPRAQGYWELPKSAKLDDIAVPQHDGPIFGVDESVERFEGYQEEEEEEEGTKLPPLKVESQVSGESSRESLVRLERVDPPLPQEARIAWQDDDARSGYDEKFEVSYEEEEEEIPQRVESVERQKGANDEEVENSATDDLQGAEMYLPDILDDGNFEEHFKNHERMFILFYAPWCVWCQRLLPTWDRFALQVHQGALPVRIAKVDCVSNAETCRKQRIMAFPTMRWFQTGEAVAPDYKLDRTVSALASHVGRKIAIDENEDLPVAENNTEKLSPLKDSPEQSAQNREISDSFDDFFASSKDMIEDMEYDDDLFEEDALLDSEDLKDSGDLLDVPGAPESISDPTGKDDKVEEAIEHFHKYKEAISLDEATFEFAKNEYEYLFVDFYASWCSHCRDLAPAWEKLAEIMVDTATKSFKSSFQYVEDYSKEEYDVAIKLGMPVVIAKIDCVDHQSLCQEQGIRGYPTLRLFIDGEPYSRGDFYGRRTVLSMTKFLESAKEHHRRELQEELPFTKTGSPNEVLRGAIGANQEPGNEVQRGPYVTVSE